MAEKVNWKRKYETANSNSARAHELERKARTELQNSRERNDELRRQLNTVSYEAGTLKFKVRNLENEARREGRIVDALLDLSERIK